ncbi:response regulator [bacterium]|nr:response regulator [bacterium]
MIPASILVVEDDVIICEDIRNTLLRLGYSLVDTVSSGEEAIEKVRTHKPDLVMMDIVLSGQMNGIEAGTVISREYKTPVVFLTAYTDSITMNRAQAAEPYGYLSKPFHKDELKAVIEAAIRKREEEKRI